MEMLSAVTFVLPRIYFIISVPTVRCVPLGAYRRVNGLTQCSHPVFRSVKYRKVGQNKEYMPESRLALLNPSS